MRIAHSAREHEVADEDMLHALRNTIQEFESDDVTMIAGAARDGALLELGVLNIESDSPVIIHAMPLRRKYWPRL